MPAGRGRLRRAIEDFAETNPLTEWIREQARIGQERTQAALPPLLEILGHPFRLGLALPLRAIALFVGYQTTGNGDTLKALVNLAAPPDTNEFLRRYAQFWRQAFASTAEAGTIEAIGALISEPMFAAIAGLQLQEGEDPESFLRRIYGVAASLIIVPGMAAGLVELAGIGQLESATTIVQTLTQGLGISVLGGGAAGAMMESGVIPDLRRAMHKRFRPARFSVSELKDLYTLGMIDEPRMMEEGKAQGWRDDDLKKWIHLAFRTLSETDIWQAYFSERMSHDEVARRLRALGYDPADLDLLFDLNKKQEIVEAETVMLSTAKRSFKEQVIGEAEFRDLLAKLGKIPREIELQVQIILHQQEEDIKRLTIAQLKAAWEVNELTDAEVTYWLTKDEYSQGQVALLLRTWKADLEPVFLKLNKGTILGAYVEGVIDRTQAFRKLQQVGFEDADARLELDLTEARSPEAFGKPKPRLAKQLAPGTLSDLLSAAFITPDDMLARLVVLGYEQADAELLTAAAVLRAEKEPRPLTQSVVERAYVAGVIDRARALAQLVDLDFTPAAAETILETIEAENPVVFAPESVQALRVPSTSALVEALRSGIIDEAAYFARMTEAGFDRATSDMYLNLAIRSERKKEKTLTAAQILEAYSRDFINRAQGMSRLTSMGYGEADATMLLRFEKSGIEDTEPWKLLLSGALAPEDAFAQLSGMGFTVKEIEGAIAALQGE
ncbi:MAG: hypothetical protein WAP47_16280 [Candidatus Rokuibacteriota bacterium]